VQRPQWLNAIRARLSGARPPVSGADQEPEDAWNAAIAGEVKFWEDWLATKGARYPGSYETRLDPDLALEPEIAALLDAPAGGTVKLLDVGAGPLTFLGRTSPHWTLDITAVDVLATEYSRILDEAGVVPPVRTQPCESEKLTTVLTPGSFDLVAARNTLDHSYDPVLAISEMVACAKPGAPILLVHHRNTGEDENYRGMHQWNIEVVDGSLFVWRPGKRTDVGDALAGVAAMDRTWTDGDWEYVVLRKQPAASA